MLGNWVLQVGEALELIEIAQQQQLSQVRTLLADFSGIIQTDGYSGDTELRKKWSIIGVVCLAHVRRKFADVAKIGDRKKPAKAHEAISRIERLDRIDTQAREKQLSHRQRFQLHQEQAKPLLNKLKK